MLLTLLFKHQTPARLPHILPAEFSLSCLSPVSQLSQTNFSRFSLKALGSLPCYIYSVIYIVLQIYNTHSGWLEAAGQKFLFTSISEQAMTLPYGTFSFLSPDFLPFLPCLLICPHKLIPLITGVGNLCPILY